MTKIRAIFLDFYNTIARFDPPRERLQVDASASLGIVVEESAIRQAYGVADDFLSRENGEHAISQRSPTDVDDLWARYEQLLLTRAGIEVDKEIAGKVFGLVRERPQRLVLFDEVTEVLASLTEQGYQLAILSNMDRDLNQMANDLGIDAYLSFTVTSRDVGAAKPHPPIFLEALRRAGVEHGEAVHVGDQYHGDVMGARSVGIQPVLIDRDGFNDDLQECPIIRTLSELPGLVETLQDHAG